MAYYKKSFGIKESSRVLSEFSIVKLLGAGGFGAVFQAQNILDKRQYALKISISQQQGGSNTNTDDQLKEVQNLAKIPPHRNIIAYTTAWKDSFNQSDIDVLPLDSDLKTDLRSRGHNIGFFRGIVIQMELCGQDLRKWLAEHLVVNEVRVIGIFRQVVVALEHLHLHQLIHRDLKPENIFFSYNDPYNIKVGDLGIATDHYTGNISQSHTKGYGTRLYIAPEQETSGSYGKPVDLYSLGLILFELFWPEMQPKNHNWEPLAQYFRDLKYQQKLPAILVTRWPDINELIRDLTNYEPKSRPGFRAIYAVIAGVESNFSSKSSGYASFASTSRGLNYNNNGQPGKDEEPLELILNRYGQALRDLRISSKSYNSYVSSSNKSNSQESINEEEVNPYFYSNVQISINNVKFDQNGGTITGNHNTITGDWNKIIGSHTNITGSSNTIIGNHNIIYGNKNTIVGNYNKSYGKGNKFTGAHNHESQY